jgi:RNA polymerase sigma factor (sigma-70 family)
MVASATHAAIAAVWRGESARVVGVLARIVRDVGLAEELAQDALVAALEEWPRSGVPDRPGAWLMTTAKNRALNAVRRARMMERKHDDLAHEVANEPPLEALEAALETAMDRDVTDDVLRLVFTACHPVLPQDARVALTLRLVGGLSTAEIARAFLVAEPTIAQRIVRAKRTLGEAQLPFEVPREELGARLASVLEVVYLIFNEGYSASAGDDVTRPALVDEALRLGRLVAELTPDEPEVLGLVALMELNASRIPARTDEHGEPVLLMDHDRARWDRALIASGLDHLARVAPAAGLGDGIAYGLPADHIPPIPRSAVSGASGREPDAPGFARSRLGPYRLQAEIAACHARAASAAATDWPRIAALYAELARQVPSPVIELNHAMAVSRAHGPAAGLELLDALTAQPALARYHWLPSARADLLESLGRIDEARAEFERAAALTDNARQRERLHARAKRCCGTD